MNNFDKFENYKNKYLYALNTNLHGGINQENYGTRNLLKKVMYTQEDYNNLEKTLNEKCNSTVNNLRAEYAKQVTKDKFKKDSEIIEYRNKINQLKKDLDLAKNNKSMQQLINEFRAILFDINKFVNMNSQGKIDNLEKKYSMIKDNSRGGSEIYTNDDIQQLTFNKLNNTFDEIMSLN